MDDNRAGILNESKRLISKVQLLSVFFENDLVYKIYLRTQVIHQLFENNRELDINKLELFHVQFTTPVIELLKKIKKNNENNMSVLLDEMEANKELINKITETAYTEKDFNLDKQRQSLKINTSLRNLYRVLSDDSTDYPFSKNINAFSAKYGADFYDEIEAGKLEQLINYNQADVYVNASAVIQRKLMGLLCKYDFRTEFVQGLKTAHQVVEVYRFVDAPDRGFIYYPSRNLFLLCDLGSISNTSPNGSRSKREGVLKELMDKNDRLDSNITITKTAMPPEVKSVLTDYYRKINDVDFLQQMKDVDVQSNIIRAMLNTDML